MPELDLYKKLEGIDYEFIPAVDETHQDAWDVRILRGDYVETVIRFGVVKVDGKNQQINYNFTVIQSPDADLTPAYEPFQREVSNILFNILENADARGTLGKREVKG